MNQSNDNQQISKASGGAKHSAGTVSKTYANLLRSLPSLLLVPRKLPFL
jgi:hypothetical protein